MWVRDDAGLHERCGDDDAAGLQEEGHGERAARFGGEEAGLREEGAAEEEGRDGDEGLHPAVGVCGGLVRGAEGEEDGVS